MAYQYRNFAVQELGCEVGLHLGQRNNLVSVFLHSFQYYFDSNQLVNDQ